MDCRTFRLLILLLFAAAPVHAAPPCAQTIRDLRALLGDPSFPLRWRETTMDDGKPLVVSIFERDGALFLSFVKTDEGLLAEGASAICTRDGELEARFSPGTTTFGPAAHWGTRYLLEGGIDFTLTRVGAAQARIETMGWSATFAALRSD